MKTFKIVIKQIIHELYHQNNITINIDGLKRPIMLWYMVRRYNYFWADQHTIEALVQGQKATAI